MELSRRRTFGIDATDRLINFRQLVGDDLVAVDAGLAFAETSLVHAG